ncbi:MAG: hypothetical protein GKR89_20660 [Candidatus Latescibacteria bacterium]|nr:hypothetical protein [Candidatus Latescibacterota bacterium]
MILPQMEEAWAFLDETEGDIVLTTHINGDGDALGACLGLRRLLRQRGRQATVLVPDGPDPHYGFLPDFDCICLLENWSGGDLDRLVVLDCPTLERAGGVGQLLRPGGAVLSIDHHADNQHFGRVNIVSDQASSASELVYHLAVAGTVSVDAETAAQLYLGILFDTGGFRFSLTTPTTLEVAAELVRAGARLDWLAEQLFGNKSLGSVKLVGRAIDSLQLHCQGRVAVLHLGWDDLRLGDAEDIVNYGMAIKGVVATLLLKEEEPGRYRVSLRSREGVDVSQVARCFGGGGHVRASGCRIAGPRNKVEGDLLDEMRRHLD